MSMSQLLGRICKMSMANWPSVPLCQTKGRTIPCLLQQQALLRKVPDPQPSEISWIWSVHSCMEMVCFYQSHPVWGKKACQEQKGAGRWFPHLHFIYPSPKSSFCNLQKGSNRDFKTELILSVCKAESRFGAENSLSSAQCATSVESAALCISKAINIVWIRGTENNKNGKYGRKDFLENGMKCAYRTMKGLRHSNFRFTVFWRIRSPLLFLFN